MLPRLLLTQRVHADAWHIEPGIFVSISHPINEQNWERRKLGPRLTANVLACRRTALRVTGHCKMDDAAERYHDETLPAYQSIRQSARRGPRSGCYEGPEVLLYVHELQQCVTYLISSQWAKHQWNAHLYKTGLNGTSDVESSDVITILANPRNSDWYAPKFEKTDLHWYRSTHCATEINEFKNPISADKAVAGALKQVMQVFATEARKLTGQARHKFIRALDMIQPMAGMTDDRMDELLDEYEMHGVYDGGNGYH